METYEGKNVSEKKKKDTSELRLGLDITKTVGGFGEGLGPKLFLKKGEGVWKIISYFFFVCSHFAPSHYAPLPLRPLPFGGAKKKIRKKGGGMNLFGGGGGVGAKEKSKIPKKTPTGIFFTELCLPWLKKILKFDHPKCSRIA